MGAACLALLVGGGTLAWDRMRDDEPTWSDSSTLRNARERGELIIGAKTDQPGLSELKDGQWLGFDVAFARKVAAHLGFTASQVRFKKVSSENREPALQNGDVDLVVASYSIDDARKEKVAFAGPYYQAAQGMLMRKGDGETEFEVRDGGRFVSREINGPSELLAHTRRASATSRPPTT
ncbi:transporter substrate-binding domain-containing protein [Streptomyces sp. M19]